MRKLIGLLVVLFASAALGADEYPARTVRVIVPFAPGGGTDIVARILAQQLSQKLGQSFVIENRPAGSGIVGPELVAHAKAHPGKLNYGSSGPGSSPHLATELFLSMTGTQMAHIAYKGIAPAITALLADEVQFSLVPIAVGMPHVRSGKLRALGVAGLSRSSAVPEIPTIAQSGVPGFEVIGWWGMLAPAKTPRSALDLLNRELRAALELPDVRRTLLDQGMDPAGGTPEQFGALIKADMDKWGEIGRRLGVKLD